MTKYIQHILLDIAAFAAMVLLGAPFVYMASTFPAEQAWAVYYMLFFTGWFWANIAHLLSGKLTKILEEET